MCIDIDGHHSGGSSFVDVSVIKKKKQVKSPSIWFRASKHVQICHSGRTGNRGVTEYVARFLELARFADDYVATNLAKVRRFENGLRLSIRGRIVGLRLQDMNSMVGTAKTIEREIEDARSTRHAGASGKRKESQSFSSLGKKQKTSSSRGFQSRGHSRKGRIKVTSQAG